MTAHDQFETLFAECPLIAILRGIRPDEAEAIGDALVDKAVGRDAVLDFLRSEGAA